MSVLVIGAAGAVGKRLIGALASRGHAAPLEMKQPVVSNVGQQHVRVVQQWFSTCRSGLVVVSSQAIESIVVVHNQDGEREREWYPLQWQSSVSTTLEPTVSGIQLVTMQCWLVSGTWFISTIVVAYEPTLVVARRTTSCYHQWIQRKTMLVQLYSAVADISEVKQLVFGTCCKQFATVALSQYLLI